MRSYTRSFGVGKTTDIDSYDEAHSEPSSESGYAADRALAANPAAHLAAPSLRAPVLQRAQRGYGNRASQNLVMRFLHPQAPLSSHEPPVELDSTSPNGGEPLEASTQIPLERLFQTDLSEVRVHTDSEASESANHLDALAYTKGRDIYFAQGMYSPASSSGQRLLAHEVAHVVQQGSGKEPGVAAKPSHGVRVSPPDDVLETEADRSAEEFVNGEAGNGERKKLEYSGRAIQRQQAQQSPTSLDDTAKSIIRGAADAKRDAGLRAVEAVWRIIREYYPSHATQVNSVSYDNALAGTGLATGPYPASQPTQGRIYVGDSFLAGVQRESNFAHHVLQVGHELEHIDQFRDPGLGPGPAKKDEREFLAFYHEAVGAEIPHTGRYGHTQRVLAIDWALRYYNCLASASEPDKQSAAKNYLTMHEELLTNRKTEMANPHTSVNEVPADPPAECARQDTPKSKKP